MRAAIPEGSPEWEALARGFTAAAGGIGALALVNPAASFEHGLNEDELRLVRATAQANLAMAHAAGLAYTDRGVKAGEHYLYELRGVLPDGSERRLAVDLPVWAGHFVLPDPPSGVTTQAGDRRVLVLWNRNPYAATFVVQRATSPGGPFQQVNPKPVAYDMDSGLDGQPLPTPQPGFLDVGAWDPDGVPTGHPVEGVDVYGPDNGVTYWYRVASRDTLDRAGPWSAAVAATPVREVGVGDARGRCCVSSAAGEIFGETRGLLLALRLRHLASRSAPPRSCPLPLAEAQQLPRPPLARRGESG